MTDSSNSAVQEFSNKIKELISDASTDITIINDVNEVTDDGIYIIDLPIFMQGKVNFINNSNQAVFNPPNNENVDIQIDWGDGTVDKGTQKRYEHTYADNTKSYNVTIKGDISTVQPALFQLGFEEIELKKPINLVSATFAQNSDKWVLKKLILPYGISQLPSDFCYYSPSLVYVSIPNSVTTLDNGCFYACTGLTSVIIPNSVTSISYACFRSCTSLASIDIPNSVTSINDGCFQGCTSLASIDIPNSVTSIGGGCFQGCTSLASIDIPNLVTSISDSCFQDCTSLASIDIPNSVTNIGSNCFENCTNLTSINIPNSVTNIGMRCFSRCNKLTDYQLYWEGNNIIEYSNYIFYNTSDNKMFTIPNGETDNYIAKHYPSDKLIERDE